MVFDPRTRRWFVFGYDQVRALLDDERLTPDRMHRFADRAPAEAVEAVARDAPWLISPQDADFAWIRPIIQAGLRSATAAGTRRAVAAAADELLRHAVRREHFDVVAEYTLALSGVMLADFLGVERREAARLVGWGLDLAAFFNDVEITVERARRMAHSTSEMVAWMQAALAASHAVAAHGYLHRAGQAAARHGRALDDETIANVTLPFLTGQIGTADLVSMTAYLLASHADQRPASNSRLVPSAVAEALRHGSPVALVPRIALQAVTLGSRVIEPGDTVLLSLAAANRDPDRFPDPDRFDIGRAQAGSLGFGHGTHSCIAAGLARMQATAAVRALLQAAPDLALDPDGDVAWHEIAGVHSLRKLDVQAGVRSA
ncbi:MAG: hypothetical protein V7607_2584 [Solirubrobacteraceae bacterium]